MKKFVAFLLLFAVSVAFAKPSALSSKRQPTNNEAKGSFKFEVNHGDKTTEFVIWNDKGTPKFFARSNEGKENSGKLSKKNYRFLLKESSALMKLPGSKAENCPRSNMVLVYEAAKQNSACIDFKNATTKKMVEFANVMSFLL